MRVPKWLRVERSWLFGDAWLGVPLSEWPTIIALSLLAALYVWIAGLK